MLSRPTYLNNCNFANWAKLKKISYTNFLRQIQIFLLFRIILNKEGPGGRNPNAFNDNPNAFNDPIAFKNLMRLMIRKGRPTSLE